MRAIKLYIPILYMLIAVMVSGCAGKTQLFGAYDNEILTMKPVQKKKTAVTIRCEYGSADVFDLEGLIENEFPNVDIIMVHDGSALSDYTLRHNLQNNVECDIILTHAAPEIRDIASDYLVDLSGQSFVSNYYPSPLSNCMAEDGKLYYLPGPSDVYGVVYNRTMFEENGWEIPHSYSEFTALIDKINNSGLTAVEKYDGEQKNVNVKALQLSLMFPDAFQVMLNTFAYDKVYRGAENQRWLMNYQNGIGSMEGHMEPAADTVKRLYEDGIISWGDWNVRPRKRSEMIYKYHSAAMVFENLNAYVYNDDFADKDNKNEMDIFPFWTSDEPDSDYVYSIPSYYYAVNKFSAEKSPKKKELLLDILEFLSLPETQTKIVHGGLQISNVAGVLQSGSDFGREIQKTIKEGRIINTFSFVGAEATNVVEEEMIKTLPMLLNGEMTREAWLSRADNVHSEYLNGIKSAKVYGISKKTFTRLETAQLVGDMYRHETGAQIALVFVGTDSEGVNGRLYEGDITDRSLECISEASIYDSQESRIAVCTMTGRQIMNYLSGREGLNPLKPEEHIVSSGLNVKIAPWSEPGKRLVSCSLPNGEKIKPNEKYRVAYFKGSLKNTKKTPVESAKFADEKILDGSWDEHFISWLDDIGGEIKNEKLTTELLWIIR